MRLHYGRRSVAIGLILLFSLSVVAGFCYETLTGSRLVPSYRFLAGKSPLTSSVEEYTVSVRQKRYLYSFPGHYDEFYAKVVEELTPQGFLDLQLREN